MAKLWVTEDVGGGGHRGEGGLPSPPPQLLPAAGGLVASEAGLPSLRAAGEGPCLPQASLWAVRSGEQLGQGVRGDSELRPPRVGGSVCEPHLPPRAPCPAPCHRLQGKWSARAAACQSPGDQCTPPTVSQSRARGLRDGVLRPEWPPCGAEGAGPRPEPAPRRVCWPTSCLARWACRGKSPCCLQITNLRSRIDQAQKQ